MNEVSRYITPSEISEVIMATPPGSHNIVAQRIGHQEHKRIFHTLAEQAGPLLKGFTAPEGPLEIEDSWCKKEGNLKTSIADNLTLSVRVDVLIGGNTCVEIKPRKLGRHALQLMYETMAISKKIEDPNGILYVYNPQEKDELYNLRDCGKNYWEEGISLAILAREIIDIQSQLDTSDRIKKLFKGKKQIITEDARDRILPSWDVRGLNNQNIGLRHEFDALSIPLISGLVNSLEKY